MDKLGYLTVNEQDAGGPRSLSSENPLQQETKREKAKTMMSESQTDILTDNIIVRLFTDNSPSFCSFSFSAAAFSRKTAEVTRGPFVLL